MKISISKKQKEEFDRYLAARDKEMAIDDWFNEKFNFDMYKELKKLSASDFARAIIEGYEVEETPEEKILENYKQAISVAGSGEPSFSKDYMQGMKDCTDFILNTLGIKIKGINE